MHLSEPIERRVFDVWHAARDAFVDEWNRLGDPRNVQPTVDRLRSGAVTVDAFVGFVRDAGVQAYRQPAINEPIGPDDVELIAWMAIDPV